MRRLTLKTHFGPLEYTVAHRPRVTKRLHMELDERGQLRVIAPGHWTSAHINAALSQNTQRVERFLARARQRQLEPLQYIHGEQHLYLGARYALAVQSSPVKRARVTLAEQQVRVELTLPHQESVKAALHCWYGQQAKKVFSARLQVVAAKAVWARDLSIPLRLRRMKRTWGNCSSSGLIKLNTHLIKAPEVIIDSVIAHELCHLREMNHGKAFYALLEGLNPGWRRDRARLRAEGSSYLL